MRLFVEFYKGPLGVFIVFISVGFRVSVLPAILSTLVAGAIQAPNRSQYYSIGLLAMIKYL